MNIDTHGYTLDTLDEDSKSALSQMFSANVKGFLLYAYSEYGLTGHYDAQFNKMVLQLVARKQRQNGTVYYNQIAEGILTQKPELLNVLDLYKNFINELPNIESKTEINKRINEFLDILSKKGIISKELELYTIIPDKNAFTNIDNIILNFRENL